MKKFKPTIDRNLKMGSGADKTFQKYNLERTKFLKNEI